MYFCFVFSFFWTLFSQVKSGRERLRDSLCSLQRIRNRDRFSILRDSPFWGNRCIPRVSEKCVQGVARRGEWVCEKRSGVSNSLSPFSLSLLHSLLNLCVSKFCSEEGSLAACVEKYVQTTLVHLSPTHLQHNSIYYHNYPTRPDPTHE